VGAEVLRKRDEKGLVVIHGAKDPVAAEAEQGTHLPGLVVVIHGQPLPDYI